MMNNKRYLKIGAAVLLSGILLITAVLTSYASSNAYEEFMLLLREQSVGCIEIDSVTLQMEMGITDNGETVLQATGNLKTGKEEKNMSGQFLVSK